MPLRTPHGAGKNAIIRLEQLPADELPVGLPAPARPAASRDASGRFTKSDGTTAIAREGGLARAQSVQLARLLGLSEVPEDHPYSPYAALAREWRDDHMSALASTVGGGRIEPGVAAIVSSAALQLAASRYLMDRGIAEQDPKLIAEGSALMNASKQNLLAAHELAARDAVARPKVDNLTAIRRHVLGS